MKIFPVKTVLHTVSTGTLFLALHKWRSTHILRPQGIHGFRRFKTYKPTLVNQVLSIQINTKTHDLLDTKDVKWKLEF